MADDYTEDLVNPETGEYAPIRPSGVPIPQGYAPVSQDPNIPLPDVTPDSDMVPYRIGRRPPGGEYTYTTGYGPRARPPIQPPQGMAVGGAGAPDMAGFLGEAMQHLPVDQAIQAADVAQRYVGYRLYKQALDRGEPADKAWGQYGMMMLKTGVGIPEVLKMQMQREGFVKPPTPQEMIRNRLDQQKFEASQAAAKARADAATQMTPYQQAQIDLRTKAAEEAKNKPKPLEPEKKAELSDAYKQLDEARKDMAKLVQNPEKTKKYQDSLNDSTSRMRDARVTISKFGAPLPPNPSAPPPINPAQPLAPVAGDKITTKEQFDALPSGTVYTGKDGKKYRKP